MAAADTISEEAEVWASIVRQRLYVCVMTSTRGCSAGCHRPSASRRGKPGLCHSCTDDVFRRRRLEPLEPYQGVRKERRCRCLECWQTLRVAYGDIRGMKTSAEHQVPACHECAMKLVRQPADGDIGRLVRRLRTLQIRDGEELRELRASDLDDRDAFYFLTCTVCWTHQLAVVSQLIERVKRGEMPCSTCMDAFHENWGLPRLVAEFEARHLKYLGEDRMPRWTDLMPAECMLCGAPREISLNRLLKDAPPCLQCSDGGPDLSGPHWVYQYHFPHLGLRKVGITHARNDRRFADHERHGGCARRRILVTDRAAALRVEAAGLAMVAEYIDKFVDPREFPQGGWTEVWSDAGPELPLRRIAHDLDVAEGDHRHADLSTIT
jgi:hypothetical protein